MLNLNRSYWQDQNPPLLLLSSFLLPSLPCHLLSRSEDPSQRRVSVSTTQGGSSPGGAIIQYSVRGGDRGGEGKRILTDSAFWAKHDLHASSCLPQNSDGSCIRRFILNKMTGRGARVCFSLFWWRLHFLPPVSCWWSLVGDLIIRSHYCSPRVNWALKWQLGAQLHFCAPPGNWRAGLYCTVTVYQQN